MARDKRLTSFAKEMRRAPSATEEKLWRLLRANRHLPVRFSRQVVIGSYIVDFAAKAAKLIVEADGASHDSRGVYDERRTRTLEAAGHRVIRFPNSYVHENPDGVLAAIREALLPVPLPGAARLSLPREAGEGKSSK